MTTTEADRVVPYADGPETWAEAVVVAPADRVWALVADPNTPGQFSDEFQEARWLDGASGPAVGARFVGNNARGDATWDTTCTIVACEPAARLAFAVEDVDEPVAVWSWELESLAEGRTRLRHHVRMGPGRSGVTWAIRQRPDEELQIVADRLASLRESMQRTVDGIAHLAEVPDTA